MRNQKTNKYNIKLLLPIVEQTSAGGVAFRQIESGLQVVIVSVVPSLRWQLPKGLIDEGETTEMAARREVREEAGVETELLELLETVEYWYVGDNQGERVRFHKFVHFYLLKYTSGDVADHDHEIAEARWTSVEEAVQMLTFDSEKNVVRKAAEVLAKIESK